MLRQLQNMRQAQEQELVTVESAQRSQFLEFSGAWDNYMSVYEATAYLSLEKLKEKHPIIREVRGKGLMIGVELKFEVRDVLMSLIEKGILMLYSGRNILRILPPLVITEEDITKVLQTLDTVLTEEEKKRNVEG